MQLLTDAPHLLQRQIKTLTTKSLTDIPGVGPKNAQLLKAAGYSDIEGIQRFYISHCQYDAELLQKHLQVGLFYEISMWKLCL